MQHRWIPFSRPPTIVEADPLSLSDELEAQVAALWQKSCAQDPSLFDGRLMMATDYRDGALILRQGFYRHYLAGRTDPALGRALGLRALGVSGLLACPDGLVFGRRAAVHAHSGMWELVPSGGVENATPRQQILSELEDEIGLVADQVTVGDPIGLVEGDGLIDLILPLSVSLAAADIIEIHRQRASAEYDRLHITQAAAEFVAAGGDAVMSVTRLVIEQTAP